MKCSMCRRPLVRAAVTLGAMVLGPVCARRVQLLPQKPERLAVRDSVAVRVEQADLFEEFHMAIPTGRKADTSAACHCVLTDA